MKTKDYLVRQQSSCVFPAVNSRWDPRLLESVQKSGSCAEESLREVDEKRQAPSSWSSRLRGSLRRRLCISRRSSSTEPTAWSRTWSPPLKLCQNFVKISLNFSKIFINFCIQYSIFQHFSKSTHFCKILQKILPNFAKCWKIFRKLSKIWKKIAEFYRNA